MKRSERPWPIVGLAALCAGAAGASIALALAPQPTPPILTVAAQATDVSVSRDEFDDSRSVELRVIEGAERSVSLPVGGVLTQTVCASGAPLRSGEQIAAVDGTPVLGLATATPLWRHLTLGDEGDDVKALQAELSRLGHPVGIDGIVGKATLRAAAAELGVPSTTSRPFTTIPFTAFAWLPAPETPALGCPVPLGSRVEAGATLATLPRALSSAALVQQPESPTSGDRTLRVGEVTISLPADGVVHDTRDLEKIAATPEYALASRSEGGDSLTATYSLTKPISVTVVPPAAVYGAKGDSARACMMRPDRKVLQVDVVASELGQTFVRLVHPESLDKVVVGESAPPPCK